VTFYRGIAFPFHRSTTSLPAAVSDDELIRQSLVQIVMTRKGERVMRPDFGTNVITFVFENNDALLEELVKSDVFTAIGRYEPRVIVTDVVVTRTDTTVDVAVVYVVTATGGAGSVGLSFATG